MKTGRSNRQMVPLEQCAEVQPVLMLLSDKLRLFDSPATVVDECVLTQLAFRDNNYHSHEITIHLHN